MRNITRIAESINLIYEIVGAAFVLLVILGSLVAIVNAITGWWIV